MGWTRKSAGVTVLLAMEEHRKQVGARVLRLREAKHWGQEDLAHAAKLSVKTISRVENGHKDSRRDTIRKIAKALGVTERDLIGEPPGALTPSQITNAGDDASDVLRQLVERQEAVEKALTALIRELAAVRRQDPPRRRRAS